MKILGKLKNLFLVQNEDGTLRRGENGKVKLSESMISNVVVLASSALVAIGGVGNAVAGAEQAAIIGGVVALGNVVIRLRSAGGTIVAKDPDAVVDYEDWEK